MPGRAGAALSRMKQGKQVANPLFFPRLKTFRALLTSEACPEARIPRCRHFRASRFSGRSGRGLPALTPRGPRGIARLAVRLARSARGSPRHVTAARARAPAGPAPPVMRSRVELRNGGSGLEEWTPLRKAPCPTGGGQ